MSFDVHVKITVAK